MACAAAATSAEHISSPALELATHCTLPPLDGADCRASSSRAWQAAARGRALTSSTASTWRWEPGSHCCFQAGRRNQGLTGAYVTARHVSGSVILESASDGLLHAVISSCCHPPGAERDCPADPHHPGGNPGAHPKSIYWVVPCTGRKMGLFWPVFWCCSTHLPVLRAPSVEAPKSSDTETCTFCSA